MNDEPPRDPRLREALRHAPDHDVTPPPAISAAILRAARDPFRHPAVRSAPRPPALARWWAWLGRPQVAGALATLLMVAGAGLLWRQGAFEPGQGPGVTPTPTAPAPASIDAPPPPLPAAEALPAAPPTTAALPSRADGGGPARAESRALRERQAPAPAAAAPQARAAAGSDAQPDPLAGLVDAIARNPQAWGRRGEGAAPMPVTPALRQWLADARQAADAHARPPPGAEAKAGRDAAADAARPAASAPATLRLVAPDGRVVLIRVEAAALVIDDERGPAQRLALAPARAAALADALRQATR